MHPIESYLPALTRYSKALVRGKHHIDHRDVVHDVIIACLNANPEVLTQGYVLSAARSKALNIFKRPIEAPLEDDYMFTYIAPYDTDEMYEQEILHNWAAKVLAQRCPYGTNTKERDKARRSKYLKEYRKKQKHEEETFKIEL